MLHVFQRVYEAIDRELVKIEKARRLESESDNRESAKMRSEKPRAGVYKRWPSLQKQREEY